MSIARSLAGCVVLTLAGCASQLYDWNMQHAYIAPSARLSQPELQQVIRVVTNKSLSTIIGIGRWTERGRPDKVVVYTTLDPEDSIMMVYDLYKRSDGLWHIVDYGEGTIIVY